MQHTAPQQKSFNVNEQPTFCTIKEAATRSGLAEYYIRTLAREGKIPMLKAGRIFRINYPALMEQLNTMSRNG